MNKQIEAEKSGWIQTAYGHRVHPLDADPRSIHLEDVAHALALQCRWNGHTKHFYSVAQHCVLASLETLELKAGVDGEWVMNVRQQLLLHDATEAYISDVPKPVKLQMPEFQKHEERLMEAVMWRFGCTYPLTPEVHKIDFFMLTWEARDLFFPERCTPLFGPAAFEALREHDRIEPWDPVRAKWEFLKRAEQLGLA